MPRRRGAGRRPRKLLCDPSTETLGETATAASASPWAGAISRRQQGPAQRRTATACLRRAKWRRGRGAGGQGRGERGTPPPPPPPSAAAFASPLPSSAAVAAALRRSSPAEAEERRWRGGAPGCCLRPSRCLRTAAERDGGRHSAILPPTGSIPFLFAPRPAKPLTCSGSVLEVGPRLAEALHCGCRSPALAVRRRGAGAHLPACTGRRQPLGSRGALRWSGQRLRGLPEAWQAEGRWGKPLQSGSAGPAWPSLALTHRPRLGGPGGCLASPSPRTENSRGIVF